MNHDAYPDSYIREILSGVKSIAMVGASPVNVRPSYFAFKYLAQRGYDMIPVNPGHLGKSLLGKPFVASLSDIGRPIDMVDIFRNSSHIMPVVDEALELTPPPKIIWMQLGARDDAAAAKAEAAGLKVVMNRCPKIEYGRLSSEISWMGVNSRTLSSKRAPMPTQGMQLSLNRTSLGGRHTEAADCAVSNEPFRDTRLYRVAHPSNPHHRWMSKSQRKKNDRSSSGIFDPRRACRRAARSHYRRASDADLSDHVVRIQRRRPRRVAVRTAGIRKHLHPHRKSDPGGAGRTPCRA